MSLINDKRIYEYLENVCSFIKNKKAHKDIKYELLCHIEDIVEDELLLGKSKDEAIEKALLNMGSYETIGKELGKIHKATPDWILLSITGLFVFIGILNLAVLEKISGLNENLALKSLFYGCVGIMALTAIVKFDYRELKKYSKFIYMFSFVGLIFTLICSVPINGQYGYIIVGPITFNFFNVTSFLFIIALSGIFENWNWNSLKNFILGLIIAFAPMAILIKSSSTTNSIIYMISIGVVLIASGIKKTQIFLTLGVLASFLSLNNFYTFLNPKRDIDGIEFFYNNLVELIKNAKIIGVGKENVLETIPNANTDFIFTYILATFGWVIAILLIILVSIFIIRIGAIGLKAKDKYGKSLVMGLCTVFLVQFLISILMNLGLVPILDISMPFISYSGTNLIINIMSIGIISSVYKWKISYQKTWNAK